MNIGDRVFDVGGEVTDLSLAAGALEMIVHPANEDLFRRQHHQVVQSFAILEQCRQLLVIDKVDRSQQADLRDTTNRGTTDIPAPSTVAQPYTN